MTDKPTACCDHPPKITTDAGNENSQSSRLSCFSSLSSAHRQTAARCLDPIPLFTNSHPKANPNDGDGSETGKNHAPAPAQTLKRCSVSNPCPADSECVGLRKGERILRITFEAGEYGRKEVLLWSGPKVEVWDQGAYIYTLVCGVEANDVYEQLKWGIYDLVSSFYP